MIAKAGGPAVKIVIVAILIAMAIALGYAGQALTFVSPVPWCEKNGGTQPCLPWRPTPGTSPIDTETHREFIANRDEPKQIEPPAVNVELARRGACIAAARHYGVDEARCK